MSNAALKIENRDSYDAEALIRAIHKVQAVIEFDPQGNILFANENFLKVTGYSLPEIQGRHHRMFCEPELVNSLDYVRFWERLARGEYDENVYKRIGKDGKEIWIQASYNPIFDENGKVYKVVKFATDITEKKKESCDFESRINAISKSQAVIEFNMDGSIITANDNFLSTIGYDLNEIKERHHRMFCDPEYAASQEYKEFWAKLNRGVYDTGEYKRIGKNGKVIWIVASYNPILDMNGKPYKVVKFATDISSTKFIKSLEETAFKVAAAAEQLRSGATTMTDIALKTKTDAALATQTSENVSVGVQTVAASTGEMVAAISEISRSAHESAEMSRITLKKAQETNKTISQLGVSGQEIGNVIKVISSIAQQTNLLALNATIEAARAGDAGKGFAVVANEVKELAKQTARATEEITAKIGSIQKDTSGAVSAIADIAEAMDKLNVISGAIAAAVEEQTASTNEVSRVITESKKGVDSIFNTIKDVSCGAEENAKTCKETLDAASGLAKLADQLQGLFK